MTLMVKMIARDALEMATTANFENLRMTQSSRSVNAANGGRNDGEEQHQEVRVNVNSILIDAMESTIGFNYQNGTNTPMSNSFKQFSNTTSHNDEYNFVVIDCYNHPCTIMFTVNEWSMEQ